MALWCGILMSWLSQGRAEDFLLTMPKPGSNQLRLLSPVLLELTLISTKQPDPARVDQWDFVDAAGHLHAPAPEEFVVTLDGGPIPVQSVGFKRRVLYAPVKQRDLRIANYLYLQLGAPIQAGQTVEVRDPDSRLWPATKSWKTSADPLRWNPMIHVNQVGYMPDFPKKAQVGYYLGSLGEADLFQNLTHGADPRFELVEAGTDREVFRGKLVRRPEEGFPFVCYQQVLEADFGAYKTPGEYQVLIPGLGVSLPFFIDEGMAAAVARTYALGLYHQRCGTSNALPFTRFTHDVCHAAPASIPSPQSSFAFTWKTIAGKSSDFAANPRHTAPQLKDEASQLYPFVRHGTVDVSGGHHDAGDYSKYTINSAALIHFLVFAVDSFPGVGELDNLGLPESGDGKSDLLQEAKWEADFLAKMQDTDGGFYFLVYPREREYEQEVLPERGDPQVVWPKTTAATAAAVAALAEMASSPRFKQQFPEAAAHYLDKAKAGWAFLERAIAQHGKDGAYQKITHYGNDFMHDDQLAWAACEMFLATGDPALQRTLIAWFDPSDPATRRWGWWRSCEGYGCAMRSYVFAAKAGKMKPDQLDPEFLRQCDEQLWMAGQDQLEYAQQSSYGTSFPTPTKQVRAAGWYFSMDQAFDLAVACELDNQIQGSRAKFLEAIISNMDYEEGSNPVNVTYLTGLGSKRQREIVDQYAQNDHRVLPPSGIPLGNIQEGFSWLDPYKQELGALSFPPDGVPGAPYPFYDRWGDSFNLSTEFVAVNQARGLACAAFLMAQTSLKNQPWRSAPARITILRAGESVTPRLTVSGLDLRRARIVWEAKDQEPAFGSSRCFLPVKAGSQWVEAEAQWPDGRRAFAVTNFAAGAAEAHNLWSHSAP
jgi:hypothetical protein